MSKLRVLALALVAVGGVLLWSGCPGRPASSADAGADDSGQPSADGFAPDGSAGAIGGAIFVATAGLERPSFLAAVAPAGSQRLIGPERGSGYGLGEGELRFMAATPDGTRVVARFTGRDKRTHLFALSTDGSTAAAPVRVASGGYIDSVVLSPGGRELLYVDQQHALYRARLDGADAAAPRLLATVAQPAQLERPRWASAAARAVFEIDVQTPASQTAATIHAVRLDGRDGSGTGLALTSSADPGTQHRVQAVLGGARLVASLGGALWAIPAAGGQRVRLTPSDRYAALVGVAAGETQLVVTLAQGANWPRSIALVDTAGASADQPDVLAGPFDRLQAIMSPDGMFAAYVAREQGGSTWRVYEVSLAAGALPVPRAASAPLQAQPYLSAFSADGRALLACRNADRTLLRIDRPADATAQPAVLFRGPASQQGCPSSIRSSPAGGGIVLFNAHDQDGAWATFRVAQAGGAAERLFRGGHVELLPSGVVHFDFGFATAALFRTVERAAPARLTPWHRASIDAARLVGDRVAYHVAGDEDAWFVVRVDGGDRDAPRQVTPHGAGGADTLVTATAARLVLHARGAPAGARSLAAYALDGSAPGSAQVLAANATRVLVAPDGVSLAFTSASALYVSTLDGAAPVRVIDNITPHAIAFDLAGKRIIAADDQRVIAAALDGSQAATPTFVASEPGVYALDVAPRRGRVLLTLATLDTAVPHPRTVLTARLSGANAAAYVPIAPDGYLLLDTPELAAPSSKRAPVFDASEELALVRGPDGLYAARVDGSRASAPTKLLAASTSYGVSLLSGLPLSPAASGGGAWAVLADGAAHLVALDGSFAARALTPELPAGAVHAARWADGGRVLVLHHDETLYAARVSGADAAALVAITASSQRVGTLQGVTVDGRSAIYQRLSGSDRSLMLAPIAQAGSPATPLSPIDDATETLVGLIP
ncbi:MAG: hypothetical protein KC503_11975 [Myxococcales bacterium]|nr:hypothetical protein [Myxococcales bacterium]